MNDLRGKTVLLTGASTGIGPYIARRLRQAGAKFVLSARSEDALKKLAKELGDSLVVPADLSLAGEPERLAKAAGHVDVLVSNAGVPATGRLLNFKVEDIDRALAVNLRAAMVLARLLAPVMLQHKSGHIVFMSSIAGKVPQAGNLVYNATKFGLRGFGLALRDELWGTGVGVSVVCPTFVSEAGMWAVSGLKANPIAGEVSPVQVANTVWSAIIKNRGEVDVAGLPLRASLVVQALAPGMFAAVGRRSGASGDYDQLAKRQSSER